MHYFGPLGEGWDGWDGKRAFSPTFDPFGPPSRRLGSPLGWAPKATFWGPFWFPNRRFGDPFDQKITFFFGTVAGLPAGLLDIYIYIYIYIRETEGDIVQEEDPPRAQREAILFAQEEDRFVVQEEHRIYLCRTPTKQAHRQA